MEKMSQEHTRGTAAITTEASLAAVPGKRTNRTCIYPIFMRRLNGSPV